MKKPMNFRLTNGEKLNDVIDLIQAKQDEAMAQLGLPSKRLSQADVIDLLIEKAYIEYGGKPKKRGKSTTNRTKRNTNATPKYRTCTTCNTNKEESENFGKNGVNSQGEQRYKPTCKECINKANKEKANKTPATPKATKTK